MLSARSFYESKENIEGGKWLDSFYYQAFSPSTFPLTLFHLNQIGTLAEVPIEPDEQTALCDGTMELPGVIACGVPGAGGYDAVFALCIGDEAVSKVAAYWEGYQRVSVCPLLGQIESGEGIRCESLVK